MFQLFLGKGDLLSRHITCCQEVSCVFNNLKECICMTQHLQLFLDTSTRKFCLYMLNEPASQHPQSNHVMSPTLVYILLIPHEPSFLTSEHGKSKRAQLNLCPTYPNWINLLGNHNQLAMSTSRFHQFRSVLLEICQQKYKVSSLWQFGSTAQTLLVIDMNVRYH